MLFALMSSVAQLTEEENKRRRKATEMFIVLCAIFPNKKRKIIIPFKGIINERDESCYIAHDEIINRLHIILRKMWKLF